MIESTCKFRLGHNQTVRPNAEKIPDKSQQLEESLVPIVRVALRKGVGVPTVVAWVRQTYDRLSQGSKSLSPDYYVPQITRLLCARLQRQSAG